MISKPTTAIHNIQALRAFSALIVIFVHLDILLGVLGLKPFGWGGVDIFFVISGFIMTYTTLSRPVTPWNFLALRLSRVVPLYWFVTIVVFALALIAPSLFQSTRGDASQLLKSLFFIPFQKSNGLVEPILFVGWSLNYEFFFYIIFAGGLFLRSRVAGALIVSGAMAALCISGLVRPGHSVFAQFYTSPIMLDFVLGIALGLGQHMLSRAMTSRLSTSQFPHAPAKVIIALLVVAILTYIAAFPQSLDAWPRVLIIGIPACAAVGGVIVLEMWGWAVSHKLVALLGNASYSIYLTSPFVTQIAQKLVLKFHVHGPLAWIMLLATVVAVCVVGTLIHLFLERPLSSDVKALLGARGRLVPSLSTSPAATSKAAPSNYA